jgi:3-isopropylmalate/(R)-2-methylmalate dehydratase small subunit
MKKVELIRSRVNPLVVDDVDTDQIIPARFLKATSKIGLGTKLFADWRFDADGNPKPDFILNRPEAAGATVLVAGDNFGCGSSREHAPWALVDYGFRAVISTSIADIFRNNSLKNGFIPVVVDAASHAKLLAAPGAPVTISVKDQTVTLPDGGKVSFPIDPFARYCLLQGVDELEFLLSQDKEISAFEKRHSAGS